MLNPAVCVILPTRNTIEELLAVSRRNDPTQWGIPGGKVDKMEVNVNAAIREIYEETGLTVWAYNLQPIYSGPCFGKDGQDFWVTTYLASEWGGEIKAEAGLLIKPMEIEALCDWDVSPFAAYNRSVRLAWRAFH